MQDEPIFYASENPNPVMRVDLEGQILYANEASGEIMQAWQNSDYLPEHALAILQLTIQESAIYDLEVDIKEQHYLLRFNAFCERGYANIYGFDISPRMKYKSELDRLSSYDALTGLYNRRFFLQRLSEHRRQCIEQQERAALLIVQIQRLTQLNQTLGHQEADGILREMANRLSACIPSNYLIARIGGNEFAVLRDHVVDNTDAQNLAQVILDNVSEPYLVDEHNVKVLCHIGVVLFPGEEKEAIEREFGLRNGVRV